MDPTTVIIDPTAEHTHTIVFLHGRGDRARNFARSLSHSWDSNDRPLPKIFPSFRWVCPQAPTSSLANSPRQKMAQWFDTWDIRDLSERQDVQLDGLKTSVARIRDILTHEAEVLGGHWERLILAGISQGAATAAHTLANLKIPGENPRLAAYLGFSGRMPFPNKPLNEIREILGLDNVPDDDMVVRNTPGLLEHCVNDDLVPIDTGRTLRDSLLGLGVDLTWVEYPDGGHWFNSPAGIDDLVKFLEKHVTSDLVLETSAKVN